ncbi:hypothetical protein GIY23_07715 [Allosaccharopolyspora coralli]|uniref:Uncharacterized protein n=1 Tax=Allosaccharopolyspora coralli TaxID=2665642 RepID=A0A5Q3Q7L2_9PSEU|nr:hypothetical protein [Allosaccharopolyspora coralli]QGK69426.1 hypothetical protein GIY23_07715 [Allosaccharopolyspora coralli]
MDSTGQEHQDGREQVVDELRQLLEALAGRAEEYLLRAGQQQDAVHTGPESCGWCPVCAVLAIMRGERPELTARLVEQLAGLLTVLRQFATEHPRADEPSTTRHDEPERPDVQRITLQRVAGRVLREDESPGRREPGC